MVKAKTAPKTRRQRRGVTRADFVGTKMANLLFQIAQAGYADRAERDLADKLRKQWDSVCPFRLNNPIVAAELEAKHFPKPKEWSRFRTPHQTFRLLLRNESQIAIP